MGRISASEETTLLHQREEARRRLEAGECAGSIAEVPWRAPRDSTWNGVEQKVAVVQ